VKAGIVGFGASCFQADAARPTAEPRLLDGASSAYIISKTSNTGDFWSKF
jgi:hypothetical protein